MSLSSLKGWVLDSPLARRGYVAFQHARAGFAHLGRLTLTEGDARLKALRALPDDQVRAAMGPALRLIADSCRDARGELVPIADNRLLAAFVNSRRAQALRRRWARFPTSDRVHLREPNPRPNPERVGDLIILKAPHAEAGDRGVLLVKYTESVEVFAATFDLRSLAREYSIVLEPSWWGYQDLRFLLYVGSDMDVVVQAQRRADRDFIRSLNTNLMPTDIGAGDWVDPSTFAPPTAAQRKFDVVMVASWNPLKRHEVLLRAVAGLKRDLGRTLQVALVGYPQTWTAANIVRLARQHGVDGQCTVFDRLPHAEVAKVMADAKVLVLLSQREGASKAVYESLFCDTPVIVTRDHRGVNLDHIVPEVGIAIAESDLGAALLRVVDNPAVFHPRMWAMAHTGWPRATERLNRTLKDLAQHAGRSWTTDIMPKRNGPELRYVEEGKLEEMAPTYQTLTRHLLPIT